MKWNDKGYRELHKLIEEKKPKPKFCENCGKKGKLELSNKDHTYKKNIEDYNWLCIGCHKTKDSKMRAKAKGKVKPKVDNITFGTLEKVKEFLKKQKEPVFKSLMVRELGVNYNSLKIALGMLKIKTEKDGRISHG